MGNESNILNHERYASFYQELHCQLVEANCKTQYLSGRTKSGKCAQIVLDYSETAMKKPLWGVESPDNVRIAGETLQGNISYESAISICVQAIETGDIEFINGGFTRERRKRGRSSQNRDHERQTVACAFVYKGRLYCGIAVVGATARASLFRPFGTSKTAIDKKEAMVQSNRCFSVELI